MPPTSILASHEVFLSWPVKRLTFSRISKSGSTLYTKALCTTICSSRSKKQSSVDLASKIHEISRISLKYASKNRRVFRIETTGHHKRTAAMRYRCRCPTILLLLIQPKSPKSQYFSRSPKTTATFFKRYAK